MFDESSLLSKIVTVAVIGLLGWLAMTTQQLAVDMAVVNSNLRNIETNLQAQSEDRYTASEAKADQALTLQKIIRLELQLEKTQERVRQLELGDKE